MEKLVIAAVCFKSKVDTNMTINAPMARMEMYGVLNLEDILLSRNAWIFDRQFSKRSSTDCQPRRVEGHGGGAVDSELHRRSNQ